MKKAIMSVLTVWILVNVGLQGLLIIGPEPGTRASAATIIIDDNGTPGVDCNYTTIQEGIDAANPGDTVYVRNGTYNENVVVNKTLNLTGEDMDDVNIYGGDSGVVVNVSADYVNITGFTINGSGGATWNAGIRLYDVQHCTISSNNVSSNKRMGILLTMSSNNTLSNNLLFTNQMDGIHLEASSYNNLSNNNIIDTWSDGVYIYSSSTNNTILNNIIVNNDNAIYIHSSPYNLVLGNDIFTRNYGIYARYSPYCQILNNNVSVKEIDDAIYLHTSNHSLIKSNKVLNNTDDGIVLFSSYNCNITDNIISSNTYYGIKLIFSSNNNISSNNISDNGGEGLYMVSSLRNQIRENHLWDNPDGVFLDPSSDNNTIFTNNVSSNDVLGIHIQSSQNRITGNNISSNQGIGLYFNQSANNYVSNNNISYNGGGIHLVSSESIDMYDNHFIDNGIFLFGDDDWHYDTHEITTNNTANGKPIYYYKNANDIDIDGLDAGQLIFADCMRVTVKNVHITDTDVGIEVGRCSNVSLTNNNLSSNTWFGIFFNMKWQNWRNSIYNNDVMHNRYGIYLYNTHVTDVINNLAIQNNYGIFLDSSDRNNVTHNIMDDNQRGMDLYLSSDFNTVSNNDILYNNLYGVRLFWEVFIPTENRFYHNNIIDNFFQVYNNAPEEKNYWNDSYPMGGNFWSGYAGVDNYNGPLQNIPGSDGIGDTDYPIDAVSTDFYPQMYPILNHIYLNEGWNLVSLPYNQTDNDLGSILSIIDGQYDAVQWFDASDPIDPWKHHSIKKPSQLNDLNNIDHTMGLWIHIIRPGGVRLPVYGVQPTYNQTVILHKGWNQVGFPSLTNKNLDTALNNLTFGLEVDSIWTYDSASQTWVEMGGGDIFELGRGYWIHATQECVWEVPI